MIFFTMDSPIPLPPFMELRDASGPVKPLKYIAEVFCRDSLAVVLDFYPDGIHLIQQANIDHTFLFVHIFDAVAN